MAERPDWLTPGRMAVVAMLGLAALGVLALPVPEGAQPAVMPALALTVFTVGLWATGALPEHIPSLAFFVIAIGAGVSGAEPLFSVFSSSAFWLIAGGVVIGVAADGTGLGRFLAHGAVRWLGGSYARLITAIVVGSVALAFLVPAAIARLIILMPIVLALAERRGFRPGSKGRTGMVLAATMATFFVPLTILPANLPNAVLAGVAEQLYGVHLTYGQYLAMHFPITGALKAVFMIAVICRLFAEPVTEPPDGPARAPKLSSAGKRLAAITGVTLIAWATDFAHGIAPGWIAAAAGAVCLFPMTGVIKRDDLRDLTGLHTLVFVAAVLALGNVIVATGAGEMIAGLLLKLTTFPKGDSLHAYFGFSGIVMALTTFSTLPGAVVVAAPFAGTVAEQSGVPVAIVLMMVVNGYSTVFFPYQGGPLLVGIRMGGAAIADGVKVTLALALITIVLLQPLNYLWWRLLGVLP